VKTEEFGMYITEVIKLYNQSGFEENPNWFSIDYRIRAGRIGRKNKVMRRAAIHKNENAKVNISHTKRQAGKLHLIDADGNKSEIWVCLLKRFNGKLIDHSY